MITVGNYPDLASARIAQSILDAEGIFTSIPDENLAGIDWQMGTALHGIRLQVPPEDFDQATAILEAAFSVEDVELATPESENEEVVERCPACGSATIGPPKWKNRLKAIGLFFPFILLSWPLFAMLGAQATCPSCGRDLRRSSE